MPKLCDYEVQILREVNGDLPASSWGAAVGAALGFLRSARLVDRQNRITDAGRAYLASLPREPRDDR